MWRPSLTAAEKMRHSNITSSVVTVEVSIARVAERAVTLADHVEDRILEAGAQENLAECCFWTGSLRTARPYFERALALCEEMSSPALIRAYGFDLSTIPPCHLGILELLQGWPERAMQWERRTIERARSSSHPYSQALGLMVASWQRSLRGDPEATSECLIQARQICDEYGLHEVAGLVKQLDGWSHFWRGERALGIAEMNEAIQDLNAVGSFNQSPLRLVLLAEMQLESGDIQAAETLIKEALETLKLTNEGWCEPEVYRIAAKVTLTKPDENQTVAEGYLTGSVFATLPVL